MIQEKEGSKVSKRSSVIPNTSRQHAMINRMTAYRGIVRFLCEEPVNTTRYTSARRLPVCSNEVLLDSSPQVYVVTDVLSSIYINLIHYFYGAKFIFVS